jgi:hypothetical protein
MSQVTDMTGLNRSLAELSALSQGHNGPHNGGDGGGDDMERRVTRLEDAVIAMQGDMTEIRTSQATLLERMDRVMDKVRDMPSERRVGEMLTSKITVSTAIIATVIAIMAYLAP